MRPLSPSPQRFSATEHLVRRLRERAFQSISPDAGSRFATVNIDTLHHDATLSIDAEHPLPAALDQWLPQSLLLRQGASHRSRHGHPQRGGPCAELPVSPAIPIRHLVYNSLQIQQEVSLVKVLCRGEIGGAGLDVFQRELLPQGHP